MKHINSSDVPERKLEFEPVEGTANDLAVLDGEDVIGVIAEEKDGTFCFDCDVWCSYFTLKQLEQILTQLKELNNG